MICTAKIRPFTDPDELLCECDEQGHTSHHATIRDYAYPGSETKIVWFEEDRRNYRGDYIECPERGCVLPAGHPRGHAV